MLKYYLLALESGSHDNRWEAGLPDPGAKSERGRSVQRISMNRLVSRFRVAALALAGFAAATLAFSVAAQQPRGNAAQQAAASDTGDFTEGNLKFHHSSSGFMTVVDTEKNQSAGTVIFPPGGAPVFAPMPGYDIKAAYEKHMRGSGASQATTATMNAASAQGHADLAGSMQRRRPSRSRMGGP